MPANDRQEGGDHYKGAYTQEHWDYAWQRNFDFFQYVITKYVERHKRKKGLEDLRKAAHYLQKYIELLEAASPTKADMDKLVHKIRSEFPPGLREFDAETKSPPQSASSPPSE